MTDAEKYAWIKENVVAIDIPQFPGIDVIIWHKGISWNLRSRGETLDEAIENASRDALEVAVVT